MRPVRTPYKVGVLVDIPGTPGLSDAFPEGVRFGLDLAHEQGHVEGRAADPARHAPDSAERRFGALGR